jgi:hypothetical protein
MPQKTSFIVKRSKFLVYINKLPVVLTNLTRIEPEKEKTRK